MRKIHGIILSLGLLHAATGRADEPVSRTVTYDKRAADGETIREILGVIWDSHQFQMLHVEIQKLTLTEGPCQLRSLRARRTVRVQKPWPDFTSWALDARIACASGEGLRWGTGQFD